MIPQQNTELFLATGEVSPRCRQPSFHHFCAPGHWVLMHQWYCTWARSKSDIFLLFAWARFFLSCVFVLPTAHLLVPRHTNIQTMAPFLFKIIILPFLFKIIIINVFFFFFHGLWRQWLIIKKIILIKTQPLHSLAHGKNFNMKIYCRVAAIILKHTRIHCMGPMEASGVKAAHTWMLLWIGYSANSLPVYKCFSLLTNFHLCLVQLYTCSFLSLQPPLRPWTSPWLFSFPDPKFLFIPFDVCSQQFFFN